MLVHQMMTLGYCAWTLYLDMTQFHGWQQGEFCKLHLKLTLSTIVRGMESQANTLVIRSDHMLSYYLSVEQLGFWQD